MAAFEGDHLGAQFVQQRQDFGVLNARIAGPERPRLRHGNEQAAGEIGRAVTQACREKQRLVL